MRKLFLFVCLCFSMPLLAAITVYEFESQEQEKRFQQLTSVLRCLQCQNQTLADTNSDLGGDLKLIIHEKIIAGDNDKIILGFMKDRYGEFILYEPELNQSNLFLWLAPVLFLVIILCGFLIWYKKHKGQMLND